MQFQQQQHRQGCGGEHHIRVLCTHRELRELAAGLRGRSPERAVSFQGRVELPRARREDRHRLGLLRDPPHAPAQGHGAAERDYGYQQ
jgi:hypothetical protein